MCHIIVTTLCVYTETGCENNTRNEYMYGQSFMIIFSSNQASFLPSDKTAKNISAELFTLFIPTQTQQVKKNYTRAFRNNNKKSFFLFIF